MTGTPTKVYMVEHRVPREQASVLHVASTFDRAVGYCRVEHDALEPGDRYAILCAVVDDDYRLGTAAVVAEYDRASGLEDLRDEAAANGYVV